MELEYQDPKGKLINKISGRTLGIYGTLQCACEAFGPDKLPSLDGIIKIRAWNFVRRG
jgi:hypothetical protein